MKHVEKFNRLEKKMIETKENERKKKDPECTFKPKLVTASYGRKHLVKEKEKELIEAKKSEKEGKSDQKKPMSAFQGKRENRLISWGQQRDKKNLKKAVGTCLKEVQDLSNSVDLSKSRANESFNLNKSLDNSSTATTIPGANDFLRRQARAKAMKEERTIIFKDDSYSMFF